MSNDLNRASVCCQLLTKGSVPGMTAFFILNIVHDILLHHQAFSAVAAPYIMRKNGSGVVLDCIDS